MQNYKALRDNTAASGHHVVHTTVRVIIAQKYINRTMIPSHLHVSSIASKFRQSILMTDDKWNMHLSTPVRSEAAIEEQKSYHTIRDLLLGCPQGVALQNPALHPICIKVGTTAESKCYRFKSNRLRESREVLKFKRDSTFFELSSQEISTAAAAEGLTRHWGVPSMWHKLASSAPPSW